MTDYRRLVNLLNQVHAIAEKQSLTITVYEGRHEDPKVCLKTAKEVISLKKRVIAHFWTHESNLTYCRIISHINGVEFYTEVEKEKLLEEDPNFFENFKEYFDTGDMVWER